MATATEAYPFVQFLAGPAEAFTTVYPNIDSTQEWQDFLRDTFALVISCKVVPEQSDAQRLLEDVDRARASFVHAYPAERRARSSRSSKPG